MSSQDGNDSARRQAIAQCEGIAEMVAALNCDWDRLAALKDQKFLEDDEVIELADPAAAAGEHQNRDDVERAIQEDPLSVQVRSGRYQPGLKETDSEPAEFEILLCTGGPAVRIRGELNQYAEPESALVQFQDWFQPWTVLADPPISEDVLLAYCGQFYFGAG